MQNKSIFHRSKMVWERLPMVGRFLILLWILFGFSSAIAAIFILQCKRAPQHHKETPQHIFTKPKEHLSQTIPHYEKKSPIKSNIAEIQKAGKIPLAIILEGFGYSDSISTNVITHISAPIAVSVSPYIDKVRDIIHVAKAANREVYVTLPMQNGHPENVDAGPHALGYGKTPDEDLQELDWCISRTQGATGLTDASDGESHHADNNDGGFATTSDFLPIEKAIASHNLLFLSNTSNDLRQIRGMTASQWLDGDTDAATIDAALTHLSPPQKSSPILLMIGPLTPLALERLSIWLHSTDAEKFTLVAPSALANNG